MTKTMTNLMTKRNALEMNFRCTGNPAHSLFDCIKKALPKEGSCYLISCSSCLRKSSVNCSIS